MSFQQHNKLVELEMFFKETKLKLLIIFKSKKEHTHTHTHIYATLEINN